MTTIYQPQSSIVLHHSSCRVAPVLVSAHPVEGSGYHQCMRTSYRLKMSKSFLAPEVQLEFPFQHAEDSCMLPATSRPHSCHKPGQGPSAEAAIAARSDELPSTRLSRSTQVFLGRHRTQVHGYKNKEAPILQAALQFKLASCMVASVYLCSKLELRRDSMMISEAIW